MEIIRAVFELVSMKILNSADGFKIVEKIVKSKKQSKYGEESEPTEIIDEKSEDVNKLYENVSKPLLKKKSEKVGDVKYKCPTCDFESDYYDEVKQHSWYCKEKKEECKHSFVDENNDGVSVCRFCGVKE